MIASLSRDIAAYDAVVSAIYQSVLEPERWSGTLGLVCQAIGGPAGWIAIHYPGQVRSTYEIEYGTDPAWQLRLRTSYVATSPFIGMTEFIRTGDVLSVGDVTDYDSFLEGRFYREWANPQGWPDLIFAVLGRETDRFSFLGVCLAERAGAEHKARAALLLPHLDRALRLFDLLSDERERGGDLHAVIDALATGVLLLDPTARVRASNPAAERALGENSQINIRHDKLHISDRTASVALAGALAACAAGRLHAGGASILIPGPDKDLVAHILPLGAGPAGDRRSGAVAALFLADPTAALVPALGPFAERFGLTPAETRVALALLEGKAPKAIAAAHGVSLPTVRTQLKRVYDKTGAAGQAALVRLMSQAVRPI